MLDTREEHKETQHENYSSQIYKTKRATRRDREHKTDGWRNKVRNIDEMANHNVAQEKKHEHANASAPRAPKFNVGMCMKESVLRSLRVSSTLTLRQFDATQH